MQVSTQIPEPVLEVLHGVSVSDPYRWLEDRDSSTTQHWIEEQHERRNAYFATIGGVDRLRARVRDLLDIEATEQPTKIDGLCFFRRRLKGQEQACLYVREDVTRKDRILVDPSEQGLYVSVAIHHISEDGRFLAYTLKRGGERTEEIHIVDVESGHTLDDHLRGGYARGIAFASENAGFYYCHESAAPHTDNHLHEVRYHQFGEPLDQDQVLLSMPRTSRSGLVLVSDGINLGAVFLHGGDSELTVDLYLASRKNDRDWRAVFVNRAVPYIPLLIGGSLFAISYAGAARGRILQLARDGGEGTTIVPEWHAPIGEVRFVGDHIFVSYQVDGTTILRRWTSAGDFLGALPVPPDGSFGILPSYSARCDALFFRHESFSEPPSILEFSETNLRYIPWAKSGAVSGIGDYRAERVTYPSKDGTPIPMWLVSRGIAKHGGCRPCILTSYGGFGISVTPRFSVLVEIMLELGCVFALPNIRGGSEFGNDWHDAARGRNRQVAYDDFLAAADWICSNGIATPGSLAIFGGSNSGLLVAAAMTQRPELFRAVLCIAPILDMLRYERFGNAGKWREEYGTVENSEDFHALHAYSPYHRVRDSVNYPATLFVTGDKDAQCDPAHVRKMAARLQNRDAQRHSILVDYSSERGHTPSLPLSVRIEALTHRLAFLCSELGIAIPEGDIR
jgi:prolyl oligopeptidase